MVRGQEEGHSQGGVWHQGIWGADGGGVVFRKNYIYMTPVGRPGLQRRATQYRSFSCIFRLFRRGSGRRSAGACWGRGRRWRAACTFCLSGFALTNSPLWASAISPCNVSTTNGWQFVISDIPAVEYLVWPVVTISSFTFCVWVLERALCQWIRPEPKSTRLLHQCQSPIHAWEGWEGGHDNNNDNDDSRVTERPLQFRPRGLKIKRNCRFENFRVAPKKNVTDQCPSFPSAL